MTRFTHLAKPPPPYFFKLNPLLASETWLENVSRVKILSSKVVCNLFLRLQAFASLPQTIVHALERSVVYK